MRLGLSLGLGGARAAAGGGGGGSLSLTGSLPPAEANQFYDATLPVAGGTATSLSGISAPAWMNVALVGGGTGVRFYGKAPETLT